MIAPGHAAGADDGRDPATDPERSARPPRPSMPARQIERSAYAAEGDEDDPEHRAPAARSGICDASRTVTA